VEAQVLSKAQITPDDFRQAGPQKAKGARRSMRFSFADHKLSMGKDDRSGYLELAFTLPAGSFATILLGEVIKAPLTATLEM